MAHADLTASQPFTPEVLVMGPGDGSAAPVATVLSQCATVNLVGEPQPMDDERGDLHLPACSVVVVVAREEDSALWRTVMGLARPPASLPVIVAGPEHLRTTAFLTGAEDWLPLSLIEAGHHDALLRAIHNAVIRRRVAGGLPTNGHLHGLVTGIAHEVNNPLTVIHADLEDACERLYDASIDVGDDALADELADLRDMLGDDQRAAQRIGALTRALQNLARLADTVPAALHTGPAMRRVLGRLGAANPGAPAPRVRGGTEWRVHGSVHGFEEALYNVLQNAVYAHTSAGIPDPVEVEITATVDNVKFVVRDRGAGVRPDLVGHELSPFVTGREPGMGLGLGLTVAALAVRRAGGDLTVRAREGGGTEVQVVFLPARQRQVQLVEDDEVLAAR